ncbi:MAG: DegT/DnrJ/EryC1/StrS family aminotransferase, partial [Thermoanaerobaculia bacterium]
GLGGIAVTPDPELAARLRTIEARAAPPRQGEVWNLALLLRVRRIFARPESFALAAGAYRVLTRRRLVVGSSEIEETTGTERPADFLKGIAGTQARVGLREIGRVDEHNRHRRSIAAIYTRALADMGIEPPAEPSYAEHTYLKYPVFVEKRDELLAKAASRGLAFSDWFRSPIHPIASGWEKWGYVAGSNPVGEEKSARAVNLPTQPGVTQEYASRVVEFLKAHRDWL